MIRLIATDLDGTLLTSSATTPPRSISPRTLAALEAAREAGVLVVPVSGRQPVSIAHGVRGTYLAEGPVIGANGAVGVQLGSGQVFFERLVDADAQAALFAGLRSLFPDVRCVSVRNGGNAFYPQHGYVGMMDPGDHGRHEVLPEFDLDEVLAEPSVKFVVRHPSVSPKELLDAARSLAIPGVHCLTSGTPFLEVSAEGVHKGSGLAALCAHLGIEASEVVALGDELNDVEMLRWAGVGVAMANATPEAFAAADERTASNDDDGVALVIERILASQ